MLPVPLRDRPCRLRHPRVPCGGRKPALDYAKLLEHLRRLEDTVPLPARGQRDDAGLLQPVDGGAHGGGRPSRRGNERLHREDRRVLHLHKERLERRPPARRTSQALHPTLPHGIHAGGNLVHVTAGGYDGGREERHPVVDGLSALVALRPVLQVVQARAILPRVRGERERYGRDPFAHRAAPQQHHLDERPAHATVAVQKRMDGLELRVAERRLHHGRNVGPVRKRHEVVQEPGHHLRRRRYVRRVKWVRPAAADPVLLRAHDAAKALDVGSPAELLVDPLERRHVQLPKLARHPHPALHGMDVSQHCRNAPVAPYARRVKLVQLRPGKTPRPNGESLDLAGGHRVRTQQQTGNALRVRGRPATPGGKGVLGP